MKRGAREQHYALTSTHTPTHVQYFIFCSPQSLPLNSASERTDGNFDERTVVVSAFLLTALFGLLVILLLLSMIIARFSLTVATISNSIDAIYKLKFAQVSTRPLLPLPYPYSPCP